MNISIPKTSFSSVDEMKAEFERIIGAKFESEESNIIVKDEQIDAVKRIENSVLAAYAAGDIGFPNAFGKIPQIKALRALCPTLSLKECKDAVDAHY